jgi:hypothetical protein
MGVGKTEEQQTPASIALTAVSADMVTRPVKSCSDLSETQFGRAELIAAGKLGD